MAQLDLTAIILSFNEAIHIERCIAAIRPHVRRVVVVDSFSTDDTVERARAMGAEVAQHPFVTQAQQFNWALGTLTIDTGWVIRLDCDEYLDDEAAAWIDRRIADLPAHVNGVEFRLKVIFKERYLRWGGYYRTDLLRMWRTGAGRIEDRWMDERAVVSGQVVHAAGNLVDHNLNAIGWWTDKHNAYASRHVIDYMLGVLDPSHHRDESALLSRRVRVKRFMRNRIYARFPLFVRPLLYWIWRYFILLGFLDGRRGLIWHFLHGYWYYTLIDTKIVEAQQVLDRLGPSGLVAHFRKFYNLEFELPHGVSS